MPDFPNELVEAAAVVCYSLAPEHDTSTYPHGYVPYDEARPSSRENARADALEVLTALYPLIEQRVIDKLAREAAGGPVPDDHPGVLASLGPLCTLTMDTSERERVKMAQIVIHAARPYLAACGVAAERARTVALARAIKRVREIEMFPDDESRDADYGPACMDLEDALSAALAPERTTTPEPEGEK